MATDTETEKKVVRYQIDDEDKPLLFFSLRDALKHHSNSRNVTIYKVTMTIKKEVVTDYTQVKEIVLPKKGNCREAVIRPKNEREIWGDYVNGPASSSKRDWRRAMLYSDGVMLVGSFMVHDASRFEEKDEYL